MVSKVECSSVIILLICLLKVGNIRAQCTKPSAGENRHLVFTSVKPSYPDGSTAVFECSVGYVPANFGASKTITCKGDTWTDLELQCKKRSCGALADIPNGRYTYFPEGDEGILYGAKATPECETGYVLNGNIRTCTEKGWNDRSAICEEVNCLPPLDPENGKPAEPVEEIYGYRRVITYLCNKGYYPSGPVSISCMENGKFETPPQCLKLSCEPVIVPNAERTGASHPYELGSLVHFNCKEGFRLVGSSDLKCEGSRWSSSPPQCIKFRATTTRQPTSRTTRPTTKAHEATTTRQPTPRTTRATTKDRDIPPPPTSPPSHNNGMKIGLGIGIPLSLLALGVGVCFCKKRSSTHDYSGNVAKSEDGGL